MASHVPKVFVSSTALDLVLFRQAARNAAIRAGFYPIMMEDFLVQGAERLAVRQARFPCP